MVSWIFIGLLILVLLLFLRFRKLERSRTKVYATLIVLLVLFLYITLSGVIEKNQINIKTFDGIVAVGKLYFSWLGHMFKNVKVIVGNVIKMDWAGNMTK